MASGQFRLRVTYAKRGRARWLSHLEVTRSLERGVRRSGLKYAITQGFNPHMRIAFGPALPVGTGGERERFDVWLTEFVRATIAEERLRASLPESLGVVEAAYVAESAPSLSAGVLLAVYDMAIEGKEVFGTTISAALEKLLAGGTLEVDHKGKTKVFDLGRTLPKEPQVREGDGAVHVTAFIRIGPEGSLRPEHLLRAALATSSLDGAVTAVTRTDTLVESEEGTWSRPV